MSVPDEVPLVVGVAAGAVFTDDMGRILFVEPTYQKEWTVPGGGVLDGETPAAGCRREVLEEIGLDLPTGPLLCVDFRFPAEGKIARLRFLFDAGILDDETISAISLRKEELRSFRFMTLEEGRHVVTAPLLKRLENCASFIGTGKSIYLEEGLPVDGSR